MDAQGCRFCCMSLLLTPTGSELGQMCPLLQSDHSYTGHPAAPQPKFSRGFYLQTLRWPATTSPKTQTFQGLPLVGSSFDGHAPSRL